MTIAILLHDTGNCINLRFSKPIICGVLLNGAYGQLLSKCSSTALVAILSPFLHPQYKISLPFFPIFFYSYLFYIFPLSAQAPSTLLVSINLSPRHHQIVHLLHLHATKCDFTYLSIWHVHCSAPFSSVHMICEIFFTLIATMWELFCFVF